MNENIILVTGMSGAGKSSAMNALEDLGYYTIDNFPKELLDQLDEMLNGDDDKYKNLALSVSAIDYLTFMNYFDASKRNLKVVFLDCSDEELLLRYRFTRRNHPIITSGKANTLEEAIEVERDYFDHLQANSSSIFHFDTSKLSTQALGQEIRKRFQSSQKNDFAITFQSFGFKHGVPMDADAIIDVRFLPNPFYEPSLRSLTGNDKEVYDYVMAKDETKEFTKRLKDYLDFCFSEYSDQKKNHMIVSVGCTGGQHRSVSVANWLYDQYKDEYPVYKVHRDIPKQESDTRSLRPSTSTAVATAAGPEEPPSSPHGSANRGAE